MKRKFNRIFLVLSGVFIMILVVSSLVMVLIFPELLSFGSNDHSEAIKELFAMDTYIMINAYGQDAETAVSEAADKLTELEQLWSVTESESEIYAVNHSNGQAVSVSSETGGFTFLCPANGRGNQRSPGTNHLSGFNGLGVHD